MTLDLAWRDLAACRDDDTFTDQPVVLQQAACVRCGVRERCLTFGLAYRDRTSSTTHEAVYGGFLFDDGQPVTPDPDSPMAGTPLPKVEPPAPDELAPEVRRGRRGVSNLTDWDREWIVRQVADGRMQKDVADELGVHFTTVNKIVSRARQEAS